MPKFNVEFYKPRVLTQGNTGFNDVLLQISNMNAAERIREGTDPAVVLTLRHQGSEFFGEAARIRMDELPSVIDIENGNRHDLDVEDREGLGEEIHFLYDADLDVIAIQSRGHFRAAALENLLADLTDTRLDFRVILTPNAWQRFQRMGLVTKISFKLARPRDVQDRPAPPVVGLFREMDEFDGVAAKMEITVGRARNRGLSIDAVSRMIEAYREKQDSFKSLSITGLIREADEPGALTHSSTVDFIKGRLLHTEEVARRGRGRRLDVEGCRVALRRAIRQHRVHLRRHR